MTRRPLHPAHHLRGTSQWRQLRAGEFEALEEPPPEDHSEEPDPQPQDPPPPPAERGGRRGGRARPRGGRAPAPPAPAPSAQPAATLTPTGYALAGGVAGYVGSRFLGLRGSMLVGLAGALGGYLYGGGELALPSLPTGGSSAT